MTSPAAGVVVSVADGVDVLDAVPVACSTMETATGHPFTGRSKRRTTDRRSERQDAGIVTVSAVMSTEPPDVMLVELSSIVPPPDVAVTSPSRTVSPLWSAIRNQPAVPVATAVTDAGSVPVTVPLDAAPNAGSPSVTVASSVPEAASFADAGCEPV